MNENELAKIRSRTDTKLRWAEAHYREMEEMGDGGSDFERSHLESCLFHLIGARDAFLNELTEYYSLGDIGTLTIGNVRNAIKNQDKSIKEIGEIYLLEEDKNSWLYRAKEWRDHTTHRGALQHHFSMGAGPNRVELRVPQKNKKEEPFAGKDASDIKEFLEEERVNRVDRKQIKVWMANMAELLERLRNSAIPT